MNSGIKDLYVGAKEIGVTGRVMNIYPTRKFVKKETQEEIKNRTITIYDNDSAVKIKLWDLITDFPEERGLKPGDLVKITRGYVKASLSGRPLVNLGSSSSIDIIDGSNSDIQDINSVTISVDEVEQPRENAVIAGRIKQILGSLSSLMVEENVVNYCSYKYPIKIRAEPFVLLSGI